jgi:glycosyltransferase involved in cell wall biosynthesis
MERSLATERVWIIIPCYNEERHITGVVSAVLRQGMRNILVVDDGSADGTSAVASEAGATVLRHVVNLGKGAAAKTGCDYALRKGAQAVILLDGDGQHDPAELPLFLEALKKKPLVFSTRKRDGNMPGLMKFANWVLTSISNLINRMPIKDTQSGYRAMTAEVYRQIRWRATDYGMESEMIAKAARRRIPYAEVPIRTIYLDNHKGTGIMDGLRIALQMLRWRYG